MLLMQVSFASLSGIFCLSIRYLLPLYQVSFASLSGLSCLSVRSLLPARALNLTVLMQV